MTLLALDTTSDRCGVLVRTGAKDFLFEDALTRGHDARLAPMTAAALAEAGVAPRALSRIVVAIGPGSFTGARVGVAFARGLALALKIPAVGVSGLDALARTAPPTDGLLIAAHDAKRGEVVWRAYRGGRPASEPALSLVAQAAAAIDAMRGREARTLVGSGAPLLAGSGRVDARVAAFSMAALADLGAEAEAAAARPEPFYHRPPDAKPAAPSRGRAP